MTGGKLKGPKTVFCIHNFFTKGVNSKKKIRQQQIAIEFFQRVKVLEMASIINEFDQINEIHEYRVEYLSPAETATAGRP